MKIYEALILDHVAVKKLLQELVQLSEKNENRRHQLIEKISYEYLPHARAEEAVLYNSMRMIDSAKKLAMHGYKEHLGIETKLRSLQFRDKLDSQWKTTALELQEAIEHHIRDEEEGIFAAAKELFTDQEAEMMTTTFNEMKPKIKGQGIIGTTWDMVVNLMPPTLMESPKAS